MNNSVANSRRMLYTAFLFAILAAFHTSCTKQPLCVIKPSSDEMVSVNNWDIIGPFFNSADTNYFMKTFGNQLPHCYSEDNNYKEEINYLKSLNLVTNCKEFDGCVDITHGLSGNKQCNTDSILKNGIVFLKGEFFVEKACKKVVTFDYRSKCDIWLNGKIIFIGKIKRGMIKKCDRFLQVDLKQGRNTFFIKLESDNNRHIQLFLRITSMLNAKEIFKVNYFKDFIVNPNVSDSLGIYFGPNTHAYSIRILKDSLEILHYENTNSSFRSIQEISQLLYFNVAELPDGFYTCDLLLDDDTLSEVFFKGDLLSLEENMQESISFLDSNLSQYQDLKALMFRFSYLLNIEDYSKGVYSVKFQRRNCVHIGFLISQHMKSLLANIWVKYYPKLDYIRSYYSPLDSSSHFFYFHPLKDINTRNDFPIIIVIPYAERADNLLVSWYIKNLDQILIDIDMAEEFNFTLVFPFFRDGSYSTNSMVFDVANITEELSSMYDKPVSHIYLIGDCYGATRAIEIANEVPDKINGMALFTPEFQRDYSLPNINSIPTIMTIYEDDKNHSSTHFKKFQQQAKVNEYYVNYRIEGGGHEAYRKDHRRYGFHFLDSIHSISQMK